MSDRLNKASLSVGSSWHLFAENIAFEETDNNMGRLGNMSDTARLHSQDSPLFGICPARSYLQLITCKLCQKVVVAPALYKHYELKHDKHLGSVKVSPPKKIIPTTKRNASHSSHSSVSFSKSKVLKASHAKQVIRIEEVDPNDTSVKIEEVPLPIPSATSKSRKVNLKSFDFKNITVQDDRVLSPTGSNQTTTKSSKKHSHTKEKEYDPEKHCGVWMADIQRNCTRSITCKAHSLSLRRNVTGRSKDFDVLLAEHRATKIKSTENSISSPPTISTNSLTTPIPSPYSYEKPQSTFSLSSSSTTNYKKDVLSLKSSHKSLSSGLTSPDTFRSTPVILKCISDDARHVGSLPTISRHPKPLMTNKYGMRQTDFKYRTFSRKMDHFRNASTAMLNRFKNLHQIRTKSNLRESTKTETEDGILTATLQDPLPNGMIHKQTNALKTSKMLQNTGSKRHLSLNDLQNQNLLAEAFNVSGITKRRHSTAIIDSTSVSPNQYLNRSISNPPDAFDKLNKVNEFLKPTSEQANLVFRRSKSVNAFTNSSFEITSSPGYTFQHQKPLSASNSSNNLILSPTKHSPVDSKTLSPAPNITITQGMLVSLPPTLFQQSTSLQQNASFAMNPSNSDIATVTCTNTSLRTSQFISTSKQSKQSSHKQKEQQENVILQQDTLSQPNGLSTQDILTTPVMKSHEYASKLNLSDGQRLAPNVTVTASHSLSGVLHSVTVCGANVRLKSPSFKAVNNMLENHRSQIIQQQLIMPMQTHHLSRDSTEKINLVSPSSQQSQTSIPQLQANYTTLPIEPGTTATCSQNVNINPQLQSQQCRKISSQQGIAQQIQLQNQHFISLHGGYQQQILPKLPTVPQPVPQFHNQQFTSSQNIQYISQGGSSSALQQQHGSTLALPQQHGGTLT